MPLLIKKTDKDRVLCSLLGLIIVSFNCVIMVFSEDSEFYDIDIMFRLEYE
jgi:hypothetical protein